VLASINKVVSFHFRLKDSEGYQLETSYDDAPTLYLHGHSNLLPALEQAMENKASGESVNITLSPEQAYGIRQENAIQRIPIKHLTDHLKLKNKLKPGMRVQVNTPNGPWDSVVLKVGKFNVDIDSNHPLAGKTLAFELDIVDVRDATPDELTHGHAHGPGGHHHD
jgi:FKBP-type peptidyl-prolyl cis-trans isomerase SlyD